MEKEIIIGVDLGGTKIMTGAIDQQGNVIGTPVKVATEGTRRKEVILDKIMGSIRQVIRDNDLDPARLRGIGVGSTGPRQRQGPHSRMSTAAHTTLLPLARRIEPGVWPARGTQQRCQLPYSGRGSLRSRPR